MKYSLSCSQTAGLAELGENKIVFTATEDASEVYFKMTVDFPEWEQDCFVMMPACAYNANRIKKVTRYWPAQYWKDEMGVDCPQIVAQVPGLDIDGNGEMMVTTGDMTTPCMGIYNREKKEGFFIFTEAKVEDYTIGYTLTPGKLDIWFPRNRGDRGYRHLPVEYVPRSDDHGLTVKA